MPFIYKAMNMSYLSIKENNTESFTILLCQKKGGLQCKPGLFSQRDRGQVLSYQFFGCHLAWHHLLRNCNVLKLKKNQGHIHFFFYGFFEMRNLDMYVYYELSKYFCLLPDCCGVSWVCSIYAASCWWSRANCCSLQVNLLQSYSTIIL